MSGYLMRIVCAAMVCALVRAFSGEGRGLRQLLCGVFLMLTVLTPAGELQLPQLSTQHLMDDARAAAQAGAEQAKEEQARIITEACEAYIWNKAAGLELELSVRVELGEDLTPEAVTLTGAASPLERQSLTDSIAGDLGLGKEAVIWIDPHQSSE